MANYSYVSVDSVLYDISLLVDDTNYNEAKFREWAIQAYRKVGAQHIYQNKVALLLVEDHKSHIPLDLKFITQIAYYSGLTTQDVAAIQEQMNFTSSADNPALKYITDPTRLATLSATVNSPASPWKPLRKSTNSFIKTVTYDYSIYGADSTNSRAANYDCQNCTHEYHVDPDGCITTTLKEGLIWISYLAYATNHDGHLLIPDDEDLKEALVHYCLFKYWMSKSVVKEMGSIQERNWHLERFQTLKMKAAAKLNEPDSATLENMLQQHNRLLPRLNMVDSFYSKLNNRESISERIP